MELKDQNQELLTPQLFVEQIVDKLNSGEVTGLTALAVTKALEQALKKVKDKVGDAAMAEADQYGESTFIVNGVKYTKKAGRSTYSYKHIPEWVAKKAELTDIEDKAKHALQSINKNLNVADNDGEIVTPAKCTYSAETLSVTFKK